MAFSEVKYAWPCSVNVANFVTVRPSSEGDDKTNEFKDWKEQMICLLESQDVMGFVNGEIVAPEKQEIEQYKLWRRTDRLVKGWILGSIGTAVLHQLRGSETARDVWLQLLDNIFKQEEAEAEEAEAEEEAAEGGGGGNTGADYTRYLPLYQAIMRDNWQSTKHNFPDINDLCTTIISSRLDTILHIAVLTGKSNHLVIKLVEIMPPEALAFKASYGETALHIAAMVGNSVAASALVGKNPNLLYIMNDDNDLPVYRAAANCQKKTLEYLISQHETNTGHHPSIFLGQIGISALIAIIASEYVDIALDLAQKYPNLAKMVDDESGHSALSIIAQTATLFPRTDAFTWWQKFVYHCIRVKTNSEAETGRTTHDVTHDIENLNCHGAAHWKYLFHIISRVWKKLEDMIWYVTENLVPKVKELKEKKSARAQALQLAKHLCDQIITLPQNKALPIFEKSIENAAICGISELVEMIIDICPLAIYYKSPSTDKDVFMLAATYRYENVINLLYNMNDRKYIFWGCIDYQDNNLMHICGKLAPSNRLNLVAGPALQMQRELQWFKEMENFVPASRRTWINIYDRTPQMLFTKEHEKLKEAGEKWMKDTANACTIAAALIATVMFAAAFTVPGGIEEASGKPLLSNKPSFILFAVSDAISLFTSVTSLLLFLSILTSRYAEEDFLYVLPKRLSMGLVTLFVSIIFMLAAFSATLYLVLQRDVAWFVVLLMAFACLPIASFVLLQFPLLVDVIYSTYGPGIFNKKTKRRL
ncbi:protein ACCELERATED CELL DEATH 6-like [Salvia splendens]|uniref:protein ACCELERATED CELL DEATH 6-like n=1 Tax=Salvia splendens TaxID=180675 RepID=UPI001C265642|nr:protein ACCELERATED CELL DEATH 6-like [Salvia splendens]